MKEEIMNDDGSTEEIDIMFMLVSRTKEELAADPNDFCDDGIVVEREKTYVYTDMDAAVHALIEVLNAEANHYSKMPEYFQHPDKDECNSVFESEAQYQDVERLEAALFRQYLLGPRFGEPDIKALWEKHKENDDWNEEGYVAYREFLTILKNYDASITPEELQENARGLLNKMISDTDWTVTLDRGDKVRTVREPYGQYFYKNTVQLKVARSITKTMLDWDMNTSMIKSWRYSETEEGKAEIEAEKERHSDMMTYMGESGLTSYTVDDDSTYSMWRGE